MLAAVGVKDKQRARRGKEKPADARPSIKQLKAQMQAGVLWALSHVPPPSCVYNSRRGMSGLIRNTCWRQCGEYGTPEPARSSEKNSLSRARAALHLFPSSGVDWCVSIAAGAALFLGANPHVLTRCARTCGYSLQVPAPARKGAARCTPRER